ncbi:MAG: EF-hand domain-containing protein [Casimicrobiaceae bacterium]
MDEPMLRAAAPRLAVPTLAAPILLFGAFVWSAVALAQSAPSADVAAAAAAASASAPIAMPHGIMPNKSELPASAFAKLDSANKGFVTREDSAQLDGFGKIFDQSDQNHDGRLNESEFNAAWILFTRQNTGQRP